MSKREHLHEIDLALNGRNSGRDALVTQSWRRCVETYGMDPAKANPAHIVTEARLREHREQSERLIAIARSGLETLFRQIVGQKYVLLLADAKGVTVDYFGDPQFEDDLRSAGLSLGSDWSEDVAGTCGVGSCIVTKEAITIHQTDHFDLTHTPLSCTAAPIFDTNGDLAAVLDISLLRSPQPKISQSLALNLVQASARRVEMANLMAENRGDWVLRFSTCPEFLDVDPEAAVALDGSGRILGMTHAAEKVFSRDGAPVLGQPIDRFLDISVDDLPDLMRDRPSHERLITLGDGRALFGHAISPQSVRPLPARGVAARPAPFHNLAGSDPQMERVIASAARLAPARVPILICGETGTGKERLARAIHTGAGRDRAFVLLNCARSLPDGAVDWPEGATVFLDNLDDLEPEGQALLLDWIIATEAMSPSHRPRFISGSRSDLVALVDCGAFREDLFFRLNAARLDLPPLRLRQDLDWFLDRILRQVSHAKPGVVRLSPAARAALKSRSWPGNLRELAHTLEVAVLLSEGLVIDAPDLPPEPLASRREQETLAQVLDACAGNMALAARRLGVNRSTVLRRARREGLLN